MSILKMPDSMGSFMISSKGEETKQIWQGRFKVKRILSHADRFEIKRVFREIIGSSIVDRQSDDFIKAGMLAEVRVRVLEAPHWFRESNFGMDMVDLTPISDILTKCYEEEANWRSDLVKVADPESQEAKKDEK